jgi:hypothetical protein
VQLRDAHETVGVEIVAEQQRVLGRSWRKQAWAAVVQEISLVDRLHAQRAPLVAEWREDRLQLSLLLRP